MWSWQPWASDLAVGDPPVTHENTHDFIELACIPLPCPLPEQCHESDHENP